MPTSYTGVPFKHNGRTLSRGVDCLGLVLCYLRDYGVDLPDGDGQFIPDNWHEDDPLRLVRGLERYFRKVHGYPRKFDVPVFSFYDAPMHCGVMVSRTKFLHIHKGRRSTVERLARWQKKLYGIYRYARGNECCE